MQWREALSCATPVARTHLALNVHYNHISLLFSSIPTRKKDVFRDEKVFKVRNIHP